MGSKIKWLILVGVVITLFLPAKIYIFQYGSFGHVLAFFLLGFVFRFPYLIVLAVLTELIQPCFGREFDFIDIFLNLVGIYLHMVFRNIWM